MKSRLRSVVILLLASLVFYVFFILLKNAYRIGEGISYNFPAKSNIIPSQYVSLFSANAIHSIDSTINISPVDRNEITQFKFKNKYRIIIHKLMNNRLSFDKIASNIGNSDESKNVVYNTINLHEFEFDYLNKSDFVKDSIYIQLSGDSISTVRTDNQTVTFDLVLDKFSLSYGNDLKDLFIMSKSGRKNWFEIALFNRNNSAYILVLTACNGIDNTKGEATKLLK